ncbi:N-acetylmuramoyl-L-alanine amidase [Nocardiopsis changdeensis]|uniref:N-acetylmuramoyl-L-alanine amidase n=1 Tax=Nocardiopsis changdeensis TaxID=2831969 RepID=A0ABX8BJ30_9ACTN|nr:MULTISPECIES: N-acetylmuramoyl-L-alanine amidase [Nocardiopsis]QUX22106.1 N-acetylmuramoyl-L-alanine amidase [Nocardiopsis changdeensis]QYX38045.1 N-acetylmuramoyl-L-alanine amidase [Nocardiopsis sp. MT53]
MPRPSKYVSRSDLGWGPSPAGHADPKSGLVVHYDSVDQNLANRDHSACIAYWKSTRRFHTGPSRGWADIGYCVDEDTQILTEDGWRPFDAIAPGDLVLTLDHTTGLSRWQPLLAVNVFPAVPRELLLMEGRGHSSLSTPGHRWPVERRTGRPGRDPRPGSGFAPAWTTSGELTVRDRIRTAAPCADLPGRAKWSDALVELVAWAWSVPGPGTVVRRPLRRGTEDAARVRALLHGLFGAAAAGAPERPDAVAWWEEHTSAEAVFRLSAGAEGALAEQMPGGVPSHGFLRSLTRAQLDLFLRVVMASAGRDDRFLDRPDEAGAEAFRFAAVLAGRTASVRGVPLGGWRVELSAEQTFSPRAVAARTDGFTVERVRHTGRIWCPTTPDGTWLARRAGTAYFTGNSFMACPHGHVLEGRGLYRVQAAQPGGNSSHYSVTLATGPKDPVTPEQIEAVRQLRQWLMEPDTSISGKVLGHRDFIATSCPGDKAYRMVRDGTFSKPPSGSEGDDDMPRHRRFEKDSAQELPAGTWTSLKFDRLHDGRTGELYSLVGVDEPDGALYDLSVGVVLEDLPTGTEVQLRATEYEQDGDGGWKVARNRPIDSPLQAAGFGHFTYTWKGNLAAGRRVRVRVAQYGERPARIKEATAEVFYWPK